MLANIDSTTAISVKMQEQKDENSVSKKWHFTKLHEKIQSKYQEMQRKLDKSKSVDSLSTLSDDFSFKESRYASNNDLRESDEAFMSENEVETSFIQSVIVEEVNKQNVVTHDVEVCEVRVVESEIEKTIEEAKDDDDEYEKIGYFPFNKTGVSHESLNEIGKELEENNHHPTPSPKSFRDRIESGITAVRERRERRKEEKQKLVKVKKDRERMEKWILSNTTKQDVRTNKKSKLATVTIALIEATGLQLLDDERVRLIFCKFRIGTEKHKSKVIKTAASDVKWQELFNLNMYDDQVLEATLWEKDTFMGRAEVDLTELKKEKTHNLNIDLRGDVVGVKLFILITITGIPLANTVMDMDDLEKARKDLEIQEKGSNLRDDFSEVGGLSVIVYGAKGLIAQDSYCMLKLANERVQTHTEYKTYDPNWMKIFTFKIADITSILEITIFEEKKGEEIGRVSIPLLRINNGAKVWYALKDPTQRDRAKGNNPRILLEMRSYWNLVRASLRVINPKEIDLLETSGKFDRRIFARNISRARAVINWVLDSYKLVTNCFEWESRKSNIIALFLWVLFCYFFKIWMLPLLLLIPFIRYRPKKYYVVNWKRLLRQSSSNKVQYIKPEKEEKSTLRQKINSLQEMVQTVQNGIGTVASYGESIKNLFNFTVPFLSLLAIFIIVVIAFVMFVIPLKYILICWGIHKFTRKILRPNRIPNSEILDLLSRVPDDETLLDCEEFHLDSSEEDDV